MSERALGSRAQNIGIIGASHIFTGPLARDLCHTPQLRGSNIKIFDINAQRAENIANVCGRYAQEVGADLTFQPSATRDQAICESDFVLNAALYGGRERQDRTKRQVSEATGIYGPVEAHAPYGQLRLMLDIAQQIEKLNPNATLIQCANPIPEGGTLITRETGVKFIGVCHGYKEWEHMARLLGMNPELAETKIAGINHNVWLMEFYYQNRDAYPRLRQWVDEVSEHFYRHFLPYAKNVDYQLTPVAVDLFRRFEKFPIGDTTRASTPDLARFGYHDSPEAEEKWFGNEQGFESTKGEASSRAWRQNNIQSADEAAKDPTRSVLELFPKGPSGWQIAPIMASIATGQESEQMVNIKNGTAIPDLEPDLVVELPARVNHQGARYDGTISMPQKLLDEVLRPRQEQAFAHANAFVRRDPSLLIEQLTRNHKVGGRDVAEKIFNIWMANDEDMRRHYSS